MVAPSDIQCAEHDALFTKAAARDGLADHADGGFVGTCTERYRQLTTETSRQW